MTELKPCPFCGKRAIVMRVKDPVVLEKLQVHGEQYMIGCVTKGCILHANKTRKTAKLLFGTGSYDNMVKMWNRRDGEQHD